MFSARLSARSFNVHHEALLFIASVGAGRPHRSPSKDFFLYLGANERPFFTTLVNDDLARVNEPAAFRSLKNFSLYPFLSLFCRSSAAFKRLLRFSVNVRQLKFEILRRRAI